MDFPTPIAEEPPTPLRTEGMATQLGPIHPGGKGPGPGPSRQLRSAQGTPDVSSIQYSRPPAS